MPRKVPEINASSMADIAFMLLIFFLVTTTMDVDSGLERKLPPPVPEEIEDTPPIKERNVFVVLISSSDQLLVEGDFTRVEDLREKAVEFMANREDKANLPEKKVEMIDFFDGKGPVEFPVTKGVISLQNDNGTTYKTYLAVTNELIAAVNELRNDLSIAKFGKPYGETLTKDQMKAIREAIPQRISEAEPKNVGGK